MVLDDPVAFLESTPLVPIELDVDDGRVQYVGPQASALLGHPIEAWYEPGFWSRAVVPDDQATMADARRNSVEGRGRHAIDYRMETADGRVLWICEILRWVEAGRPRLRGFLWDVSDRKRQEVALWRNEERLRALVRRAPDAMLLTDQEGRVLNMNDQAEALFDYALSDIVGSSIDHLLPEPLRPRLAELRAAFERDPARRSLVEGHSFAVQRSDGSEIPVELSVSLVSGDDDERQLLWSARDLTVRRRVEQQRRSGSGASSETVRARAPMACSVDLDGRIRHVTEAYARCYGSRPSALEGRAVRDVLGEHTFARLEPSIEAALAGEAVHLRCEITDCESSRFLADVGIAPQHEAGGRVGGYSLMVFPA